MKYAMLLLGLSLYTPIEVAAQVPACQQQLATLTVPRLSYAEVKGDPFEGLLYVYVPEITATSGTAFQRFQVWIVEGVYGKPFMRPVGTLDAASFEPLRKSTNVRTTPVAVVRGDGSDAGQFRIARNVYTVQVPKVITTGNRAVQINICR